MAAKSHKCDLAILHSGEHLYYNLLYRSFMWNFSGLICELSLFEVDKLKHIFFKNFSQFSTILFYFRLIIMLNYMDLKEIKIQQHL